MIKLKRAYEAPSSGDGARVLVDRLWPRGLTKAAAKIDLWLKEIAPSDALRRWFGHDPARWKDFRARYARELRERPEALASLRALARRRKTVTLVFAAKDSARNNAAVLRERLIRRASRPARTARRGFTLIELMIVVAIVGILAAVAVPKFADLIRKSEEGATKGNLGALRGALGVYYGDMEGSYPTPLSGLTVGGKSLDAVPTANAPGYHTANSMASGWLGGCSPGFASADDFDSRGWAYCATPTDSLFGVVMVNCTHTDTKGSVWTSY